eukprot:175930_1
MSGELYVAAWRPFVRSRSRPDPRESDWRWHVFGEVFAVDAARPDSGPVFVVPVTVVRPHNQHIFGLEDSSTFGAFSSENSSKNQISFPKAQLSAGTEYRRMLHIPEGATTAELTIRATDSPLVPGVLYICTQYLVKQTRTEQTQYERVFGGVQGDFDRSMTISVEGGRTLELCLALSWTSVQSSVGVEVRVRFGGLTCSRGGAEVVMSSARGFETIEFSSALTSESLIPSARLTHLHRPVAPTETALKTLGSRDREMDGKQIHELVLTYSWKQPLSCKVSPRLALFHRRVYEACFGGLTWLAFDSRGALVGSSDCMQGRGFEGQKDAEYTLKLQLTHSDTSLLEKAKNLSLILAMPLEKSLTVEIFSSELKLFEKAKFPARVLRKGQRCPIVLKCPELPESLVVAGDELVGSISAGKDALSGTGGNGSCSMSVPLRLLVSHKPSGEKKKKKNEQAKDSAEKEEKKELDLAEKIRDLQVEWISKLKGKELQDAWDKASLALLEGFPHHIPVLLLRLKAAEESSQRKDRLEEIIRYADAVITEIDLVQLSSFFGLRRESTETKEERTELKEREDTRAQLVEAFAARAKARAEMCDSSTEKEEGKEIERTDDTESTAKFIEAFQELQKWTDTKEKFSELHVTYEEKRGRLGAALEVLNSALSKKPLPSRDLLDCRVKLLRKLGWDFLAEREETWQVRRFTDLKHRFS